MHSFTIIYPSPSSARPKRSLPTAAPDMPATEGGGNLDSVEFVEGWTKNQPKLTWRQSGRTRRTNGDLFAVGRHGQVRWKKRGIFGNEFRLLRDGGPRTARFSFPKPRLGRPEAGGREGGLERMRGRLSLNPKSKLVLKKTAEHTVTAWSSPTIRPTA
jgi:hypothetical protein